MTDATFRRKCARLVPSEVYKNHETREWTWNLTDREEQAIRAALVLANDSAQQSDGIFARDHKAFLLYLLRRFEQATQ